MAHIFQPYYFPEEAGYPLGGPNDLNFFVLQIHYDNPTMKPGKIKAFAVIYTSIFSFNNG